MNTPLPALACEHVTAALNTVLASDPQAQAKLGELAGKTLLIHCTQPDTAFCLHFKREDTNLWPCDSDEMTSSRISGPAPALLRLLLSGKLAAAESWGLSIDDNAKLLLTLIPTLRELAIDWEAILAPILGDLPAHLLGQSARSGQHLARETRQRLHALAGAGREELGIEGGSVLDLLRAQLRTLL